MSNRLDRRTILKGVAAGLCVAPLLAGPALAARPVSVVATTGMVADAARIVGGDLVEVRALMGPGVDPHSYRQTRSDIVAMSRADLVLRHGLYLEAQLEDFLNDLAAKTPVVAVGEAVPAELLIAHSDYADKKDPHVWMVPELWTHVVDGVAQALAQARPEAAATFAANAQAHKMQLAKLGAYSHQVLGTVPQDNRVLVTSHDAFSYFGQAYGFEVLGIQGISTESEAGLARIAELVDLIVARNLRAVFVESSVSDRNIRALIEGAGAKGHVVEIGGSLFSDAMGPEGTYEGTYLGMIDHNVTTISRALGGAAPARGMAQMLN